MKPPMLEPLTQTRSGVDAVEAGEERGHRRRRRRARAGLMPSADSPWPRWSKATRGPAAGGASAPEVARGSPCATRRRAGSTIPARAARDCGSQSPVRASPSWTPRLGSVGGAVLLIALRNLADSAPAVDLRPSRMDALMAATTDEIRSSRPRRSIRSGAASTSAATSRSAAATWSSWRPSSARPPTSTPRTTSAPAPAPTSSAFEARTDDFEVLYASKALPCHRRLPAVRRGGPLGRRRLRRRAPHGAAGRLRSRRASTCTATTRPRTSSATRSTRASAT